VRSVNGPNRSYSGVGSVDARRAERDWDDSGDGDGDCGQEIVESGGRVPLQALGYAAGCTKEELGFDGEA
jgi:hypothetical protein